MIKVKHFLDRARKDDGRRFWVQPVGITRDLRQWCRIDGDLKDLAPPRELWEWFREHPDEYPFFRDAYHASLESTGCKATIDRLAERLGRGAITLLHDEDHPSCNTAAALRDYLLRVRPREPDAPLAALYEELADEAIEMLNARAHPTDHVSGDPDHVPTHAQPLQKEIDLVIRRGLAIYVSQAGEPVLLMPNPDGLTRTSAAEGPLAAALRRAQRRVITFDPPGAFRSTRAPTLGPAEMVGCACESLDEVGVTEAIDVVAAGNACLCAAAFAMARPKRVRRLILIGPIVHPEAIRRHHGMPWCWGMADPKRWLFLWLRRRLVRGRGSLAAHKRLLNLTESASYYDPSYAEIIRVNRRDGRRSQPMRYLWEQSVRHLDCGYPLHGIRVPTLVFAGRFDRRAPVGAAADVALRIPYARMEVFEFSGHAPYVEERELFVRRIASFFHHGLAASA